MEKKKEGEEGWRMNYYSTMGFHLLKFLDLMYYVKSITIRINF